MKNRTAVLAGLVALVSAAQAENPIGRVAGDGGDLLRVAGFSFE